ATKSLIDSYLCTDGLPVEKSPLYKGNGTYTPAYSAYDSVFVNRDPRLTQSIVAPGYDQRSEEHTSELQSRFDLVCRLLPEKKIERLGGHVAAPVDEHLSARNRFAGGVTSVEVSGVLAQGEMEAGPQPVVAILSRDAA